MDLNTDKQFRAQLVKHLKGGEAFTPVDKILEQIPSDKVGSVPDTLPYSIWQQFYHLRFTQLDILKFSTDDNYSAPNWPADYWPEKPAPDNEDEWNNTVLKYFTEREQFCELISDPDNSLTKPFPHGSGQNLLRETLLIIEHTAYHTGEMLVILRLLGLHAG